MVSTPSPSLPNSVPKEKRSHWGKTVAAVLLSLIFPGAGQLLNRQPLRATLLAGINWLIRFAFYATKFIFVFWGLALSVVLWAVTCAVIAVDAGRGAWRPESGRPRFRAHPLRFVCAGLAVLFFTAAFDPGWLSASLANLKGFRVPSDSMCPTICLNERMIADMNAFVSNAPKRGDMVLIARPGQSALFVKRLVGLPGDTVSRRGDEILVNGQPVEFPAACGVPVRHVPIESEIDFSMKVVSRGEFFVVGDNLPNSFDSRLPEFGPVKPDQIRGRPLFLYWSPGHSRIGCAIR